MAPTRQQAAASREAGLLLFRLLYYLAPLMLSLLILGVRGLLLGLQPHRAGDRAVADDAL